MAIPHFNLSSQSRRSGASSIAKAAYNAGVILHELSGERQEYNKKGGIRFRALMYADTADGPKKSREEFWQSVERSEKRKDACVSREIQAALPCELSYDQNLALAQSFAAKVIKRYGLAAADLAIHYPTRYARKPGASGHENPHLHLLFPDRDRNGKKLRVFCNNPEELKSLRKEWENHVNAHLKGAGVDCRISLDTNKKQIEEFAAELEKLKAEEERIKREIARLEKLEKLETREEKPMTAAQHQPHRHDIRAQYMGIVGKDGGPRIRRRMEGIGFDDLPEPTRQLIANIKRNIDAGGDNAGHYDILAQHLAQIHIAQEANAETTAPREGDAIIYHRHADKAGRMVDADKIADAIALRLRVCGHGPADAVRIMRAGGMPADTAMYAAANIYHTDRGDNAAQNMGRYADQWRREERGQETTRRTGGAAQTQAPRPAPAATAGPKM